MDTPVQTIRMKSPEDGRVYDIPADLATLKRHMVKGWQQVKDDPITEAPKVEVHT